MFSRKVPLSGILFPVCPIAYGVVVLTRSVQTGIVSTRRSAGGVDYIYHTDVSRLVFHAVILYSCCLLVGLLARSKLAFRAAIGFPAACGLVYLSIAWVGASITDTAVGVESSVIVAMTVTIMVPWAKYLVGLISSDTKGKGAGGGAT
jgi:hypothetical protein